MTSRSGPQRRGHPQCVCKRDSCGEHGCRHVEVVGDSGDVGAGDCESEEGQGGARGGESRAEAEEDWVLRFVRLGVACDRKRHTAGVTFKRTNRRLLEPAGTVLSLDRCSPGPHLSDMKLLFW